MGLPKGIWVDGTDVFLLIVFPLPTGLNFRKKVIQNIQPRYKVQTNRGGGGVVNMGESHTKISRQYIKVIWKYQLFSKKVKRMRA